jgi:hypothetical protein
MAEHAATTTNEDVAILVTARGRLGVRTARNLRSNGHVATTVGTYASIG